jgi:uroporphyrinogen-III decarboxylase
VELRKCITLLTDPVKAYNQDDATGFIRLNALRLKVSAKVKGKKNRGPEIDNHFTSDQNCRKSLES